MTVRGWNGVPVNGAIADIIKATQRLNPVMELDVDVLSVVRAAQNSTKEDWQAGVLTDVTAASDGSVKITESAAAVMFSQTTASSVRHVMRDGSATARGPEEFAIDFFPDPNITGGVAFTLDSIDVHLSRRTGTFEFLEPTGLFRVIVGYYDTAWRIVPMGDPIDISASAVSLSTSGAVYKIDFTGLSRVFVFDSGNQQTRTGQGFDGTNPRNVGIDAKGVSHLPNIARGLSISIQPVGKNFAYATIGLVPNGTAAAFDTTQFWRVATNRNCGPYFPDNQPYAGTNVNGNPDDHLVTGAVPGYGAKSVANGYWGIARRIPKSQIGQDNGGTWEQPYHVLRVKTYLSSGTLVSVLDMGGTPTNDVQIRINDSQPKGTSMAYTMRRSPDNSTWTSIGAVSDGQILTGSNLARYYELTATFTPGPTGGTKYASPALQAWAMVERVPIATYRYLKDVDATVTADPTTAQSQIAELKLPVLKPGRVDFHDIGTQLGSSYAPANIEAHVYARNTISGTRLFLNSYRLENRNPLDGSEEMIFVSGMDRLSVKIPGPVETYRYPTTGQAAATTVTNPSGSIYRVAPTAPGFTASALVGYRMRGVTGSSAGLDYTITANTTTTFDVTAVTQPPPVSGDTFEIHSDQTTRPGAAYVGQDFAAIYKDVLSVRAAVPARYRGVLPATTGRTATFTLPSDGSKALDVLQDVALHCGGFPAWNKGRIDYVDFYGSKDSVVTWDERHYVSLTTPLGADRRMPSVRVKYGWQADTQKFTYDATYDDFDTILGWGRPNLFDVTELPDNLCKWNDQAEAAHLVAKLQKAWKSGVRLWNVKTVLMYPWLEQGDAVTIMTDQYTDRRLGFAADGLTDLGSPVAGRVAAVGVIVGKNLWGTDFIVAIRGLDAVSSTGASGAAPAVPAGAGVVPGLVFDYNADAMLARGHVTGEILTGGIDDESGQGNRLVSVSSYEPVLEADVLNGHAVFNLTGNKAATTTTEFITPTAGCAVFAVVKRTGSHAEVGIWWRFANLAGPGAIGNGLHLNESNNFGPAFNQNDKLEIGGAFIDALDTDWVIAALRYSDPGIVEAFINGVRVNLLNQDGTFIGTSINPSPEGDSPRTFTMGNGQFSGQNGKTPRQLGYKRALTDAEMIKVNDILTAEYFSTSNTPLILPRNPVGDPWLPFDPGLGYVPGGVATDSGFSWLSIKPSFGVTPVEGDYWTKLGSLGGVQVGGQIGGTDASPTVLGIRETSGPTLLTTGAVNDGEFLKRVGTTLVSATPPGSGPGSGGAAAYSYLGYNTVGGSTEALTNNRIYMKKITVATNGIILNIAAYLSVASTAGVSMAAAVLTDNAGSPDKILAAFAAPGNTLAALAGTRVGWLAVPIGFEVVPGDYWIAFSSSSASARDLYYDTGTDRYTDPGAVSYTEDAGLHTVTTTARMYSIKAAFLPTA